MAIWKTQFPIFGKSIILRRSLETPKHIAAACEFRFSAQANLADDQCAGALREAKIAQVICPSGTLCPPSLRAKRSDPDLLN
jgi:hypothetical protein